MGVIRTTANEASKLLGAEKGVFPAYRLSIYSASGEHYRNAFRTCVAPTGTTYMIVTPSITGGIEPVFLFAHKKKNILGGMTLSYDVHYLLEAELRRCGLWKEDIIERITKKGTVRDIQEIPEEIRRIFVCSHDIKPRDHVMVQAAFQQHIDNSISKTCNFPEDATVGDVVEAYKLAWQMGCKGLTVYRNNSRLVQVLESHEEHERKIIAAGDSSSAFVPLNIFGKQSSSSLRESSSSQEGSPSSPVGSDVCEKRSLPSTDGGDEPSPTLKRFRSMLAPPQSSSSSSCSVTECPHCVGSGRLERSEGCVKCAVCGWGLCG